MRTRAISGLFAKCDRLVWCLLLSACAPTSSTVQRAPSPDPSTPGVISGVVRDAAGKPVEGASVMVEETKQEVFTDARGRYAVGPLTGGGYTVTFRRIGYFRGSARLTLSHGSTAILDHTLRFTGDGPPVAGDVILGIWAGVVAHYRPRESEHARRVAELTGTPSVTSDGGVVLLTTSHHRAARLVAKLDSLVSLGFAKRVCGAESAFDCPDTVFTTFLALGVPTQDAPDKITVSVEEIAINPTYCRDRKREPMMSGMHQEFLYVQKGAAAWRVVGSAPGMSGTVVCGGGR